MQSVSDKDIAAGASYLGIMEENLEALKKGL
jgi:ABC-type Zn uptake system ZnuABC Zn-binding protein ZnuA